MAKTAVEAAGRGQGWLDSRRRRSPAHKHGRVIYLEVFYNLVMCRYCQRGRPPMLFVTRREWSRPGTRDVLVQLLPIPALTVVTAPYLQLDTYAWAFGQHWTELVPVRWGGYDIKLLGQLADQFADAEQELRATCTPSRGRPRSPKR